jgi:multidrug efflux pump subunit AcrA (membrane-fusion protein)
MRDRQHLFRTIGGALAVLAAAGCGTRHAAKPAADGAAPGQVTTIRAIPAGDADLVLPAHIAAGEEVMVTARIGGRVTALPYREGDRFAAGAPLASFDAPEAREALRAARAALEAATGRSAQARLQESRIESLFVSRVASQPRRRWPPRRRRSRS